MTLESVLQERFGFPAFRPHQRAACEALVAGDDVLLVMPTGAGKSLCYQLPAVARGGNALVISPLISLMEDQVVKLQQQGLRAARIHSGRPREESRQACFDWVEERLDFLFVAPERLRVPGFVEWLARRKPSLIAVDEAHCISHWGHDFRPDYRLLSDRLKALTPAPVIALTATATPPVQRDIVEQLGINGARRLIHGFRRENIAVEVCELTKPRRHEKVLEVLSEAERLPAIVYVPSRKECTELAGILGEVYPCRAYHAGLDAGARDAVQHAFMGGELRVVVATIAFGMGIDKDDVRTVIHTALPASVEGYYQEIGRAGRDGKPSRAVLLYGWADRRLHEFFLERDYPPVPELRRVFLALSGHGQDVESLAAALDMDSPTMARRLERLLTVGAAQLDADGWFTRGQEGWEGPYEQRVAHRRAMLDAMYAFADGTDCRMRALVAHFGDRDDDGRPCGKCDICAPDKSLSKTLREPTPAEVGHMHGILDALNMQDGMAKGRLHKETFGEGVKRRLFEELLSALELNGLVQLEDHTFDKPDGTKVNYRKVFLTETGREVAKDESAVRDAVRIPESGAEAAPSRTRNVKPQGDPDPELLKALKEWRRGQAAEEGLAAFRVLGNKVLEAIAAIGPKDADELLSVPGIGPAKLEAYGKAILKVIKESRNTEKQEPEAQAKG
jgi:ATP-dependent DNA helicase RecQ